VVARFGFSTQRKLFPLVPFSQLLMLAKWQLSVWFDDCSEQNFPLPTTWDGAPSAGEDASAPDGDVGSDPLLMLLGDGETLVVGAF
jgi:hypothetical protein